MGVLCGILVKVTCISVKDVFWHGLFCCVFGFIFDVRGFLVGLVWFSGLFFVFFSRLSQNLLFHNLLS